MFKDKVAVVTGAGGTLCSEIAIDLARQGALVVLVGRTKEKLQAVQERIAAFGGKAWAYTCDVTEETAVNALANFVENEVGLCDFLINGARTTADILGMKEPISPRGSTGTAVLQSLG